VQHAPPRLASAARARALLPWIIFPAILLVYLLFPTKNYYWDGVFFARVIEAAPAVNSSLLHPSHLLYNVFGYGLYKAARTVGLHWRAIEVLQFANSVVSILTALLLYQILRRSPGSIYFVWALTLLFAFSATWWTFSTDANAYIFSMFFLLLALYFTPGDFRPRPLLVAVLFSVATLFHQLAVIAYPAIAVALFWQASGLTQRRRTLIAVQFCVLSFFLVFTTYYYCFYLLAGTLSLARFAQWVTYSSPDASFSFDLLSNTGYTVRGNVRLFFKGRLSLLTGLINPAIVVVIAVFAIVVLLSILALVRGTRWRHLISRFSPAKTYATPRIRIYLLWFGLYIAFLFFWLPQNTFYRLFYLPAIILFLGELLARRKLDREKPTYRLGLFVAVMTFSNFLFFIYPNSHTEKYPPLSFALEMNNVWQPGTVVYFHSENSDNNLVAYFNPAIEWRPLRDVEQMQTELKQLYDEGKTAWFDASAIDQIKASFGGSEWLARHGRPETWRERKARGYNIKFIQVGP